MKVSTLFDLFGSLLVILAAAVALWPVSVPASLAVAGICLLALSWLIDRTSRTNKRRKGQMT